MTTEQYWQQLDTLAASKGTDRLLEASELLRDHPELPLLISCHRANGRIQHLFTSFDERSPDATGNRYLICFTSEKQAKKAPSAPVVDDRQHADGPDFSNLEERYPSGRRRKKGATTTWKIEAGETARVSTGKVLAYVRRSRAVGGLIFNPGDERHSLAIAKFLLE